MPRWTFVLSAALVLSACGDDRDGPRVAEDVFAPLGEPIPAATPEQRAAFERGEAVALRRFQAADGLGPHFNLTFCGGCHEKPVFGGSAGRYRNFFLTFDERASGSIVAAGVNGIQAQYSLDPATRFPTDENGDRLAIRNPIPFFGTGLIAELPEEAILANQDPFDEDGDGISGRANFDRGFVGRFGRKAQTVSIEGFIRGPLFNHLGITTDPLTPEQQA
ncbi:MAG TPA: di-heme oxidoredictase family protein, partial [Polyangiaceae bacterium LLY-WYZ-14_1]|nr:di-heme oxidoredictase family protein [Polyangiaceae bacterium LLY-WYZ-14_1]